MSHKYDIASQLQYGSTAYRTKSGKPTGATIKSGGCGPSSVRNLGNNLLGWNTTIPKVAQIAVDCGARYDGGTTISVLLKAMQGKYGGFTYRYTKSDTDAFDAVKNGAMCIIHTPGAVSGTYNKLLSSAGHFLCLAAVDDNYGYIIDSCSYSGKWTARTNRKKHCKLVQSDGLVRVTLGAIRAAIDYYYIVTKTAGQKTADTAKAEAKEVETTTKIKVNGTARTVKCVQLDGHNYLRMDQLGEYLPVKVGYDGTPLLDTASVTLEIDGEKKTVTGGYIAPGKTMAYVTELMAAVGYTVTWDSEKKMAVVKKK